MEMTKELFELGQKMLEMQIEVAKLKETCDNLKGEIAKLKENGLGTGVFLDGVPEIYRKEIQRELDSGKR